MPPKQQPGILGLLLLPFSFALKCVFYPAQWIMWLLIDFLGAEVITKEKLEDKLTGDIIILEHREYWLPYLMGKDKSDKAGGILRFKDAVRYLKEFRTVLYEWSWPRIPSPPWRCKSCSNKAEWYCVDCGKKFCPQCCYNQHAPGMFASGHSVERLTQRWRTCHHFITPLVPELMFLAVAIKVGYLTQVFGQDYLDIQMICPIVTEGRRLVGRLDTSLLYHYKDSFFSWCNTEDSYMRFIMDTWVRTIVTRTDNALLIFQMFPKALVFNVVVMYTLVPVLATIYALIVNATYQLECLLPDDPIFCKLERIARRLSISEHFAESNSTPVETERRRRKEQDFADYLFYEYQRRVRAFKFYYTTSREGLQKLTARILMIILVFRLVCFYARLALPVRAICRIVPGLGSTMSIHEEWYAGAQKMMISEDLLQQLALKAWKLMPRPLKTYTFSLWRLALVAVLGCVYLVHRIVKQRKQNVEFVLKGRGPHSEACITDFGQKKHLVERD
mmetsp:Transcript_104507/g.180501  ORF Transcript_104507/g.180501 Transcript_104507/m.180501 type:complete len:503 (+) Transcript_104507:84-1592(+)